jgi:hypothetical protein
MANVLNTDKQIVIIAALAEGSSATSPETAVRVAIMQEIRNAETGA